MNAATQNEMERLVRVNREQQTLLDQIYQYVDEQGLAELGQSRVKALIEAHKRAEAESGALAAHVERVRSELRDRAVQAWCGCEHPACKRCRDDTETERVLAELPTTTLARLIANKQAEALEQLAADRFVFDADELRDRASELRRQAEGGEE